MHPSNVRKDGRAFEVTKVLVESDFYLHSDYDLDQTLRRITTTGHLIVLEIRPKVEGLLGFSGRWDERADSLDIDPVGGTSTARSNFYKGRGGYQGHHPTRQPDRRFDVHIVVPDDVLVFRGVVSFGLGRELEVPGDSLTLTGYSPLIKITGPISDQGHGAKMSAVPPGEQEPETALQEYTRRMVEAGYLRHAPLSGCPDCGQSVAGVFDHECEYPEDHPAGA